MRAQLYELFADGTDLRWLTRVLYVGLLHLIAKTGREVGVGR